MHHRKRWLAAGLAAVVACGALGVAAVPQIISPAAYARADSEPAHIPPALVREHFRLQDGNDVTFAPNARNYAARTSADAPLLLFLPATRERPSNYTSFLSTARSRGYHVLALDYWNNGRSVQMTCGTNPNCYTDMQRNRLDGSHPNQFSAVDPANSIIARLTAALAHLQAADPNGGWGRFSSDGAIDWSDIVVAGHSQGGGESAYISHLHRVLGVLMFSSPVDSDNGIDASWMSHPGATPASRMYGFDDTGDVFSSRIQASWDALGMKKYGAPQNVAFGMMGGSHELLSSQHLGTAMESHSFDITDSTPRDSIGHPIFAPVWKWMLTRVWADESIGTS